MTERRVVRPVARAAYGSRTAPRSGARARSSRWRPTLRQRRAVWLVVIVAVAVFCLWRSFLVRQVTVNGAGANKAAVQSTAEALVQSSMWSNNLLTLNSGGLVSKLQQAMPALRSVQVTRRWPHTVVITTALQEPSLGWVTNGQAYVLDRDGTVIGPLASGSTLPVVTDGSNLPVSPGKRVVSTAFVGFVQQIAPAVATLGYKITGFSIQDTTFDLTATTNKGYSLIFDTTRPASSEVADLKAVMATLAAQKQTPANYIDLRIAGKAYYK